MGISRNLRVVWDPGIQGAKNALHPKGPSPVGVGREKTANDGATDAGQGHDNAQKRGEQGDQLRGADLGVDNHGHGVQAGAASTLGSSEADQLIKRRCRPTGHGRQDKDEKTPEQDRLPSKNIR